LTQRDFLNVLEKFLISISVYRSAVMTDVYRNMGGFEPVPYVVKYKPSEELPAEHREDTHDKVDEDDDDEVI